MEETVQTFKKLPIIDFSLLHHDSVIKQIHEACRNFGFFHVINHGIPDSVIEEALNVNSMFFDMPMAMKEELLSDDVQKPARFSRVQVGCHENGMLSRDFLKLYAHPLHHFLSLWPSNPLNYRENMGMYATEVRKLGIELFGAIMESLNLSPTQLKQNFEHGAQLIGINSYPPCSESNVKAGTSAHTDHSIITVLLQSSPGLHIMDRSDGAWKSVSKIEGSLEVIVGDHLEVISNGLYRSVLHRALPSSDNVSRLSIADFHSLGMDDIVEPTTKLVDEKHPKSSHISLHLPNPVAGVPLLLSGFYGSPFSDRRKESWQLLGLMNPSSHLPWLVLPVIMSDHNPLLINCSNQHDTGDFHRLKLFRYEATWFGKQDCKKIVEDAWSLPRVLRSDGLKKV
ncbi:unnamed protein product [Fraxinus pennsylvanica]|uniref:Fe2OG dioxygenase domain-containing protein n=1 Tax=Fraxinus pennsylvanica TaxID=56036 RepID=A0AAD1ZL65_9LAMI|nr:unnamed protein product [Fraxinus pennsylvanica]